MSKLYSILPNSAPFKQLSGSRTVFKKQLVRFGEWVDPIDPSDTMRMDDVIFDYFVRNFKLGYAGHIPVPLGHPKTDAELVELNKGLLIDMMVEGDGTSEEDGLYGLIEIRDERTAEQILSGTLLDCSISFTYNFLDDEAGVDRGPTIRHVGLVNNPFIKRMGGFTALSEAIERIGADIKAAFSPRYDEVRMLSETPKKEIAMTKVKNDREFPVEIAYKNGDKEVKVTLEAGTELELSDDQVEDVQKQLADATAPESEETEDEKAAREAKEAEEAEAAEQARKDEENNLSEAEKVKRENALLKEQIRKKEVNETFDTALSEGKLVPAQKDAFVALAEAVHGQTRQLSDGKSQNLSEVLADFIAKAPVVVSLNKETGKQTEENQDKSPWQTLSDDQRKGLQASGISEEQYNANGGKNGFSVTELIRKKEN